MSARILLPALLTSLFAGCAASSSPVSSPVGGRAERAFVAAAVASAQLELAESGSGQQTDAGSETRVHASSIRAEYPQIFARANQEILPLEDFGETTLSYAEAERVQVAQAIQLVLSRVRSLVNPIGFMPNSSTITRDGAERIHLNADFILRSFGPGAMVAVVGFAEPTERRDALGPTELAKARADAVVTELHNRRVPTGSVRGGGAGTERAFGGSNYRALIMFFARDSTTPTITGPRVRGPVSAARSRLEGWASRQGWGSSQNVEPFEVKFPQVRERSTERGRQRYAAYRVFFVPDSQGCYETHVFYNFFSKSVRERDMYSTTADRTLSPRDAPTTQSLLRALDTLERCNG